MYILTIILRFLREDLLKCIFLSVCLALGMLNGTMFLCQAYQAWYSYFNYKESIDYEHVVVVQVEDKGSKFYENTDLKQRIKYVNDVAPYRKYITNLITYKQNLLSGVSLIGTNGAFQKILRNPTTIDGKWIESENDCVIGNRIAKQHHIKIGDRIGIDNYDYTVVGINKIMKYEDYIFIDDTSGSKRFDSASIFDTSTFAAGFDYTGKPQWYYIILNEKVAEDKILELKNYIIEKYKTANIQMGKKLMIQQKKQLFTGWGASVILSLLSLAYGIININNIEKFYFMKRKKMYGSLMAYGATVRQLFAAIYYEIGMITFLTSIILYLSNYLLSLSKVSNRIVMRVDLFIFLLILFLGQIYSLVYAWFNTKSMQKKAIRTMF